ncbi:hypothetical protein BOX15_Mlig014977g1 [Macrostomum lignano]|uniref:Autophagy-related protein 2 n=1 Tax=Macrostomum lignano TaxID=282301 RepID=A0A267EIT0_9PLAT|nr:hypothetical protein BOX15_Mlig014977g3 [Macrostomum lignano]PAA61411.1 hypothetical protein BOX15_Mlig014977g1 [Macrostomum lignano]
MRPARNLRLLPDSIGFDSNAASAPPSGLSTLGTPPMDSILLNPAWGATPFSSKRDLIGKGGGNGQSSFVWESRVLPADPAEMSEFRTNSAVNSRLVFELTLARCLINLDCQSNLEMLYNRLLNDLTLWQPAAPAQCDQRTFLPAHINFAEMLGSSGASFSQQFTSFRSSLSAGGSEDEDESRKSSNKLGFRGSPQQQSDLCLSISIQSGRLVGNLPLCPRDLENPQPQAQQAGAVLLDFTDAEVFTVTGHGGNPNKVYTTVALGDFSLYHAGLVPLSFFSEPCFHQLTAPLPEQLQLVLSPNSHMAGSATDKMQFSSRRRQPMLSLAVDAELKSRLKECSIALLVSRAALHYRMQPRQQFWLSQLMNMFELLDYPIEGYSAPLVRTTLHVSFSDIALNYRPTKLQIGSILTVRNAYISSTVQLEANSSACDFLFENADLYLTDRAGSAKWKRDYAHVAGFEVLELHVGMNDSTGVLRKPKFILNCSSRGLQFHLCSDSLQALLSLMSHLANEGDLTTSSGEPGDSADESSCSSSSLLQKRQQPECNNSALSSSVMSSIPMQLQEALSDAGSRAGEADEHVVESQDDLGFTIVDEPGLGLSVRNGDFEVKKICRQPIRIDDHFYPVPAGRADKLKEPKQLGIPLDQVTLRDISFSVSLYGGLDFRATTSNSVTLALSSASYSARQLPTSSKQQSACGRRSDQCMQLQVKKLSVRHSRFPDDSQTLQRQVVIIEDLEILDKVATSPINSFLYRHTSELMPRQTYTPMLSLKLSHQKSESAAHKAECLLMVSLQPVRLIVDQDAFYFLKAFFAEVSQRLSPAQPAQTEPNDACSISAGAVGDAKSEDSFESTGEAADAADSEAAVMETSRQINLLFDELAEGSIVAQRESEQQHQQPLSLQSQQNQQQQLYFRCFVFSPEVFIRLDFNGGRFKPSEGTLGGIALGLLHLNDVELRLKRLEHRGGLLGIDRLCTYALGEWVLDLRDKQKGQVVRGLGPARVFLQLLTGLRDLVWLPVDSWMRHGLLLRGLQRGANSFASSSGAALLDLTGRILGGLQAAAALSQDVLSPLPLTERRRQRRIRAVSRGASARGDFRDACAGAVRVIRETASDTADEMRAAATEGGVVGMIRQLPGAAIGPVVALTGAGHCLTTGAFNHLQPSALADERHKWKGGSV